MSRHKFICVAALALAACGDDSGGGGGPAAPGAPGAPPPAAAAPTSGLIPRVHIEDRVPEAEKASIRHTFKERDFVADTNRDPFQSFVVLMPGTTTGPVDPNPPVANNGAQCTKPDQMVATNYSYADLRLVGIVAQGTQRKVLMMDSGNLGHIIHRGDCVGKEKAMVKDIGTGYLTFVVMPETAGNGGAQRPAEEHSVQLHPSDLPLSDYTLPHDEPRPIAPVMPAMPPAQPAGTQPTRPAVPMPAPVPTPAGVPLAPTQPVQPVMPPAPPAGSPPART